MPINFRSMGKTAIKRHPSGRKYRNGRRVIKGVNDLATCYPAVAATWHPTKNDDLQPTDVLPGSHRPVWWICEHGHEWQA